MPNTFDTEKINAAYKNGVLTVTLPKKEAAKPRQIKVEVAVARRIEPLSAVASK